MYRAVWTKGVVGELLVVAAYERHFGLCAERVDTLDCALTAGHQGVHFLDVAGRQGTLVLDELEDAFDGSFVVLDHRDGGFRVGDRTVGNQRRAQSVFDEQLSDPAVQCVEALDEAGLDGPLTLQTLLELAEGLLRGQQIALFAPDQRQRAEFAARELIWAFAV